MSVISSFIQAPLGAISHSFGNNPTAKSVFREATKFPGTIFNCVNGTEKASTGIHYDMGQLVGASSKLLCRGIIFGGTIYAPGLTLERAAIPANIVCDIPDRVLKVTSREYQTTCKNNDTCSLSYTEFMWENLEDLSTRGIKEIAIKGSTASAVGSFSCWGWIKDGVNNVITVTTTQACRVLTGANPNLVGQAGIYRKASTCLAAGTGSKFLVTATFGLIEASITAVHDLLTSYIFVPLVNAATDSSIPDLLFVPNVATTVAGIATTAVCCATPVPKKLCFAAGVAVKVGIDNLVSNTESDEPPLAEGTTTPSSSTSRDEATIGQDINNSRPKSDSYIEKELDAAISAMEEEAPLAGEIPHAETIAHGEL